MITGLNHITFAVTDLQRACDFYHHVLGFTILKQWEKGAYFLVGDLWFCLNVANDIIQPRDSTHVAFTVAQNNFAVMKEKIIVSGALIWQENKSEGDSLYFCDPEGHKLEIHVGDWQSRLQSLEV